MNEGFKRAEYEPLPGDGLDVLAVPPFPAEQAGKDPLYFVKPGEAVPPFPAEQAGKDPLYFVKPGETPPPYPVEQAGIINPLVFRYGKEVPPYPGDQEEAIIPPRYVNPPEIVEVLEFVSDIEKEETGVSQASQHLSKREEFCNSPIPVAEQKPVPGKAVAISVNQEKADIIRADESSATNFTVQPLYQRVFINRNGDEVFDKSTIACMVSINQRSYQMVIYVKEIKQLPKLITQRFPEAILDYEEKMWRKR